MLLTHGVDILGSLKTHKCALAHARHLPHARKLTGGGSKPGVIEVAMELFASRHFIFLSVLRMHVFVLALQKARIRILRDNQQKIAVGLRALIMSPDI